ncbi:carbohydrate ABC transporter permease [Streptomyces sp. 7-21]|jgi:multiple sugar transport system permease protein|uniref:carbohydrate ABC transporter permease n=1 Tax=Streptomyces sp. 7-21 TaxID=2802283 RepID=UPI00191D1B6F|nr:carbohydrate ABC transporter permease [Streptomyces sp. 7-21]MBL1066566.1 carbohydrate ABC transporter permease [Streptomyces sp. 7-21]
MTTTVTHRPARAARRDRPARGRDHESRVKILLYVLGGGGAALVFAVPLVFALMRSLQPNDVVVGEPSWSTFFDWTGTNFRTLLTDGELARSIVNSLIVSLATAAFTALLATLAGYGFARFSFRGRGALFSVLVLTMMVPFQAILTPLYLQMNSMGLTDSLLGLVMFYTTLNLPFGVFVMRNSFAAVPSELEDSGHVDGAGTPRMLLSVLRPLITPGIATVALYAFLASWTEFLGALTFLTDQDLYTLPVTLANLQQGTYGTVDFGLLAAGAVIAMVPCVVLYVALQRFYVAGLAAGSVKG